ncbi:ribonuclease III [Hymenopellis radicata]|nr:ribonuclease III [Hymenopellis radicata]
MLKIWKGKWKQETGSNRLQVDNMGDADGGVSSLADSTSSAPSTSRLNCDNLPASVQESERPPKRRKTKHQAGADIVSGFPRESIVLYDPCLRSHSQSLDISIAHSTRQHAFFNPYATASQQINEELGLCASDLSWKRALVDIENSLPLHGDAEDVTDVTARMRLKARDVIKSWTFSMPNLNIYTVGCNVSPKFLRLVQVLKACEPMRKGFRGIVFVSNKTIACAMLDLIRAIGDLQAFRCQVLGGDETPETQEEILQAFGAETYNLLIASSLTEDLDIPRASLVVRFSLPNGYLSHAYTYSRSQGSQSQVILLAEKENSTHRLTLELLSKMSDAMKMWGLEYTPSVLPPSTSAQLKPFINPSCVGSEGHQHLTEPVTGARIYPTDATMLIYRIGAQLREHSPTLTSGDLRIEYEVSHHVSGHPAYVCRIILPGLLTGTFAGDASVSKSQARRQACYAACAKVIESGLLDPRLVSFATMNANTLSMPPLSEKNTGTRQFIMKRPNFWRGFRYGPTKTLYPTVICADSLKADGKHYGPLIVLTRDPLMELPAVQLYFAGVADNVPLLRAAPMEVDEHQLSLLNKYTIRAYRLTTNKRETCSIEQMAYFVAPLVPTWTAPRADAFYPTRFPNVATDICWDSITVAAARWAIPLKYGSADVVAEDIADAVVQDRAGEFTRRYDHLKLRPDLTPLSNPEDRQVPGGASNESLLDYVRSHSTTFEGLEDENQCIIQVNQVANWFDHLSPAFTPSPDAKNPKYLIPEVAWKCTIPARQVPFNSAKITVQFKRLSASFGQSSCCLPSCMLLPAITAPSVGYDYDYERLELLGDAFLKYISSIYVFVVHPEKEGVLHAIRKDLISNASLLSRAVHIGLPQYVQAKNPLLKMWLPPHFKAEGKPDDDGVNDDDDGPVVEDNIQPAENGTLKNTAGRKRKAKRKIANFWNPTPVQWLGDKVGAVFKRPKKILSHNFSDRGGCRRGYYGCCVLTGGRDLGLQVIKDLGVPLSAVSQWSDFARQAVLPSREVTVTLKPGSLQAVEKITGYKFKKPHLLAQALTHISHKSASYERLEFLGDAVLDFLVIRNIFREDERHTPGALTILKAAMVSNNVLAALCVYSELRESNPRKQAEEYALAEKEGRMPGQYWFEVEAPKPLADIVESVLGAAYVTENFNIAHGPDVIYEHLLKPFYDRHISLQTLAHHPTRVLFERVRIAGCRALEVVKKDSTRIKHHSVVIHGKVMGIGEDRNASVASRLASVSALEALDKNCQFLTRVCVCRRA